MDMHPLVVNAVMMQKVGQSVEEHVFAKIPTQHHQLYVVHLLHILIKNHRENKHPSFY